MMRIALIADVYPPLRSSGAVQLRDLSREFSRQGHEMVAIVAAPELAEPWKLEAMDGVHVLRLKTPQTKDVSYIRRTVGEFLMPFALMRNFRRSPLVNSKFDAIIWYSPTIFLGPIVRYLKRKSSCPSYLVIRDIFPQWALDMGLLSRGLPFWMFDQIAKFQYRSADIIGVQTAGNANFIKSAIPKTSCKIEVLQNWLADSPPKGCSIGVKNGDFAGRKIFVYAGNMGVAQGMEKLMTLAYQLKSDEGIGFVFVGRGSEVSRLREEAAARQLTNVRFYDEIDPDEIAGLYEQSDIGVVCLDKRHKTHNIPGKFISYMMAGLPVLASINAGNDLSDLIRDRKVGRVSIDPDGSDLASLARELLADDDVNTKMRQRCRALAEAQFSSRAAVTQIVKALEAATD